nr:hypothetical protein [Mycoplasmopsis bovis]
MQSLEPKIATSSWSLLISQSVEAELEYISSMLLLPNWAIL